MKIKVVILALFVLSTVSTAFAQPWVERETKVKDLFAEIGQTEDIAEKNKLANKIQLEMIEILMEVDSFEYDFPTLENVGSVMSSDKMIHMYSWNVIIDEENIQYFAMFQNKNYNTIHILAQGNSYLPNITGTIAENKWYGALYYDIHPIEYRDRPMYIVFGLMPTTNGETQHKVIDVLSFSKSNVKVGASMFKRVNSRKKQYRVLFEIDKLAQMSIDYDKRKKRIVYNHLVPIRTLDDGKEVMAPDESFDALVYKKDLWTEDEDVRVKAKKVKPVDKAEKADKKDKKDKKKGKTANAEEVEDTEETEDVEE